MIAFRHVLRSISVPRSWRIPQAKIMRSPDRVDANGQPRSKGYGFVEFVEHAHALAALRQVRPESRHRRGHHLVPR